MPTDTHVKYLLALLSETSAKIYNNIDPYNPYIYLDRARIYVKLRFHDLAAADAYRALTLLECVFEPDSAEYIARRRRQDDDHHDASKEVDDEDEDEEFIDITRSEYDSTIGEAYVLLVQSLARCGCLRDAYDFHSRAVEHLSELMEEENEKQANNDSFSFSISLLKELGERISVGPDGKAATLPVQGCARRVLYPWNNHEPNRKAPETLTLLNKRLETVAPNLEVRAVALPALHGNTSVDDDKGRQNGEEEVSIQLGLFAKRDLQPGEVILRESSLLTATNRLHDDLCDACNGTLPNLSADSNSNNEIAVACQKCDDIIFCSQTCHDQAQATYHGALCGQEGLEAIGKDVADPKDKADYLYFLLLVRSLAMAATQDIHPLELPEIKYIWGDFHEYHDDHLSSDEDGSNDSTLPFSFQLNILQPMRLLEEMGLDPLTTLSQYDTWILNTLYAKFRGTASGRLSTWDGGPEVCAVHPLWCLANHSCDPNVRWEWGGEICFVVRKQEEKAVWRRRKSPSSNEKDDAGDEEEIHKDSGAIIRMNEEILNHYCDIGLDVQQRRDWAKGALGGLCQCARCQWEAA